MQAIDALETQGLSPEEATLEAALNHSSVMGNIRDDDENEINEGYLYAVVVGVFFFLVCVFC